jgi:hypothetical protein
MIPALCLICTLIVAPTAPVKASPIVWRVEQWGRHTHVQFKSAPFPHTSRIKGFKQFTKIFPAGLHYSERKVAVMVPHGISPLEPVNLVVFFHDHNFSVAANLRNGWPQSVVEDGSRNAVHLFPQGPKLANDSCFGRLDEPGGLQRMIDEALDLLRHEGIVNTPRLGKLVLIGFGQGCKPIAQILSDPAQRALVSEVDLIDALFNEAQGAASKPLCDLLEDKKVLFRSIFTRGPEHDNMMLLIHLNSANRAFQLRNHSDANEELLRKHADPLFIFSSIGHKKMLRHYTPLLLKTGVLERK